MFQENEVLKKENISLSSKLNDICEGNNSLKNQVDLISQEKDFVLKEKKDCFKWKWAFEKENYFGGKRKGDCFEGK